MKTFLKRIIPAIMAAFLIAACHNKPKETDANSSPRLPRVAIAGLAIESSTFSPAKTHEEAFHARVGDKVIEYYPFLTNGAKRRKQAEWFPTLKGHALPGGIVTREAYESLLGKTLEMLKGNMPYDGVFLDIHGAMSVEGLDDPEGDYIARVREVVGTETLISTCMDLHGNVSERLASHTDLMTCYRLAPHEDAMESKQRAVDNLLDRLESGKGKPAYKAWIPVPILLPGEKTSTRIEPGKSLYAQVEPLVEQEGIIDAGIWVGYAWADEPRNRAAVMVVGDNEKAVSAGAEQLAKSFWEVRHQFEFVAPTKTLEECLEKALASDTLPFIISDMGDNPTAGGAGDVTWTLNELLKRDEFKNEDGPSLIYASIPGPGFVERAMEAGVGNQAEGMAGAEVDSRYAPPLKLSGKVLAIKQGDKHAETEVVVQMGSLRIIVTKKRKPYHHISDFTHLGLNPSEANILMVKIGYLVPELYDIRGDWLMALTPGGVDQDLERLDYQRIERPMFPLDKDMADPDLSTRWMPLADKL